ncbi:MAG: hypothetical protein QM811_10220 [Pirellulales bacterium]
MLDRVCGYMDVDPESIELKFLPKQSQWLVDGSGATLPGAAGTYQNRFGKFRISLSVTELREPTALVGTIAHELAHVRLMGEDRMTGDEFDNELLTDLTVVHFGLGVFLASSPRVYVSGFTKWPETDADKPEYMTSPMFGWALAHLAWHRGEATPDWLRHVQGDSRDTCKQGLRYLFATQDSWYRPSPQR